MMKIPKPKGEVWFLASCVELYKDAKNLSGQDAYNYLRKTGAVDFIINCWEGLHTTSPLYIVDSIDEYIKNNTPSDLLRVIRHELGHYICARIFHFNVKDTIQFEKHINQHGEGYGYNGWTEIDFNKNNNLQNKNSECIHLMKCIIILYAGVSAQDSTNTLGMTDMFLKGKNGINDYNMASDFFNKLIELCHKEDNYNIDLYKRKTHQCLLQKTKMLTDEYNDVIEKFALKWEKEMYKNLTYNLKDSITVRCIEHMIRKFYDKSDDWDGFWGIIQQK